MIKPTIGRVVWYYPENAQLSDQPFPALVCYVHSDEIINVAGFDANGLQFAKTSVPLIQDEAKYREQKNRFACWMPYQKAQAEKTDK